MGCDGEIDSLGGVANGHDEEHSTEDETEAEQMIRCRIAHEQLTVVFQQAS